MSEGFASSSQKNYGSTGDSRIPEVVFSGSQFSPTELYDLPDKISSNIQTVSGHFKQLEQFNKTLGSPKDSVEFRNNIHEIQTKLNGILNQTSKDLQRLTVIVKRGDKKQKFQADKLTTSFKDVVQMYSSIQKRLAERLRTVAIPVVGRSEEDEEGAVEGENTEAINQAQLTRQFEFEQGMLVEREQRIRAIEDDILDVNQIMRELAAVIVKQGESINTVEDFVENTQTSVEAGNRELQKAAAHADKRRRKTCILLAISIFVGLILVLSIILTLK